MISLSFDQRPKPWSRTLRGEKSEGMLLAALDGDDIVIIVPEKDVASGSAIL